ncbi:MAG: hypothetical protein WDO73_36530 [Ignavibacteriota bacterium]
MSKPHSVLLQILVGINPGGTLSHKILSYLDGNIKPDPLVVNVGDEVGFVVQVLQPVGRQMLPYRLDFSDTSFFGVSTLNVPAGGTSPFLRVLSLDGKVKYTLSVIGLGTVFDPEIQSGGDGPRGPLSINTVLFTWDVGGKTATYKVNGTAAPFSTPLSPKDTVEFQAVNAGAAAASFTVTFPTNLNQPTHWASPFNANLGSFVAPADNPTDIGSLKIKDSSDTGNEFPFTASVTIDNQIVYLPGNIAPYIQM